MKLQNIDEKVENAKKQRMPDARGPDARQADKQTRSPKKRKLKLFKQLNNSELYLLLFILLIGEPVRSVSGDKLQIPRMSMNLGS